MYKIYYIYKGGKNSNSDTTNSGSIPQTGENDHVIILSILGVVVCMITFGLKYNKI